MKMKIFFKKNCYFFHQGQQLMLKLKQKITLIAIIGSKCENMSTASRESVR